MLCINELRAGTRGSLDLHEEGERNESLLLLRLNKTIFLLGNGPKT